ncbi:MAG: hypothetical protein ABEJ07_05870 [Candidatus Nanohaloarchaea archaeon]
MGKTELAALVLSFVFLASAVSAGPRSETSIDYRYSTVIVSVSSSIPVFVTVNNTDPSTMRTFNTSLSEVAHFPDGSFYKVHSIGPMQERRFRVVVDPTESGSHTLKVTTRDTSIGLASSDSIPVSARKLESTQVPREVPGIGLVQLVLLSAVSTVLFAVSL